ncbi:MAG TPA: SGNH/GDSL hydrolase family protein [Vicinamibacterales bacterium]|nr:SGNH/GDSL hydrolase family protein [Vicinamibacterales bacterium]
MRDGESNGDARAVREIPRSRRVLAGAIAIAIGVLLAFAILEFGFARFYYTNTAELRQDEFDPELGWRLKPGTYTVKAPQAFRTHVVSINQMGLREAHTTPRRTPLVRRVVVLGDSFTFGQGVDDETLFTTQLERRLNEPQADTRYEVINAGVPGYGTGQEWLLTRRLMDRGVVGHVYVLNLFTNDLLDNLRLDYGSRMTNPVQPGFTLDETGRLIFSGRPQKILREGSNLVAAQQRPTSMLFSVLQVRLRSLAQTRPGVVRLARTLGFDVTVPRLPGVISAWYDDEVLQKGVPLMKALLAEIDATVKRRNAVLLVSLIPSPMQVYKDAYGEILRASFPDDPMAKGFLQDPNRAQRLVRSMCQELNVPFLDVYDVFAASNQSLYVPVDGHFNEAGHELYAESLERFVGAHMPEAADYDPRRHDATH